MMETLILLTLLAAGAVALKSRDQNRRIALLGRHLGRYRIENLMERLTQGYLRALGESDPQRRDQIWHLLASTETDLCEQFNLFAAEFSKVDEASARVSKIGFALAFADRLFSNATFDFRHALRIHAQGISEAIKDRPDLSPDHKAFILLAEMFLMQHSCHWFCRSKMVASVRMLKRHQTTYAQALAAVSPATRQAYCRLVGN